MYLLWNTAKIIQILPLLFSEDLCIFFNVQVESSYSGSIDRHIQVKFSISWFDIDSHKIKSAHGLYTSEAHDLYAVPPKNEYQTYILHLHLLMLIRACQEYNPASKNKKKRKTWQYKGLGLEPSLVQYYGLNMDPTNYKSGEIYRTNEVGHQLVL